MAATEVTNYVPGRTVVGLLPGWYDGSQGRYVMLVPTIGGWQFLKFSRSRPQTGAYIDTNKP